MGMLISRGIARLISLSVSSLLISLIAVGHAGSQSQSDQLVVTMPSVLEIELAAETPLEIRVGPVTEVPSQSRIHVRGLPSNFALSQGRPLPSGIWTLSVRDLHGLKIAAPETLGEISGLSVVFSTEVSIAVVAPNGATLAEATSTLIVTPPAKPDIASAAKPFASDIPPDAGEIMTSPQKIKAVLSPEEMERVKILMEKGDENLKGGRITVARLFYKRAADLGWAPGAMALGGTYDAVELGQLGVIGIQGDAKLATRWYEVARELGAREAQQRIARLGAP